jgi:hypothetical protein
MITREKVIDAVKSMHNEFSIDDLMENLSC